MASRARRCISKGKQEATQPDPVILSDNEEEESVSAPATQPFQNPPRDDGGIPVVKPITSVCAGQASVASGLMSACSLINQLENAMKQAVSIIKLGWGSYTDCKPFLMDRIADLRRLGETHEASSRLIKLLRFEHCLTGLETLSYADPSSDIEQVMAQARARGDREREVQEKELFDQGGFISHLLHRQCQLRAEIDASASTIARMRAQLAEEEATFRDLQRRSADVQEAVKTEKLTLQKLHQECSTATATFEARIREEAEELVRVARVEKLAKIQVELASLTEAD